MIILLVAKEMIPTFLERDTAQISLRITMVRTE